MIIQIKDPSGLKAEKIVIIKKSIIKSEAFKCVYDGKLDFKCVKNVSEIEVFDIE